MRTSWVGDERQPVKALLFICGWVQGVPCQTVACDFFTFRGSPTIEEI